MNVKFEKVIDGISKYIDGEIYVMLNDWQEIIARMAVGRLLGNRDLLKQKIMENPLLMSFAMIDAEGNMDVDLFLGELKNVITQKGGLKVSIPMFGHMKFVEADVDRLRKYITNEW